MHWLHAAPRLVAEALRAVPVPAATLLQPGPVAPAAEVARALVRAVAPPEATGAPPRWLRQEQVASWRRVVAALRHHGGAMLADAVGSGKTHVALAAAASMRGGWPVTCLVPAPLLAHWRAVSAATGVPVCVWSHQRVSRGRLPPVRHGPVIVDESHHFRHPTIRRYGTVAAWLVGRPTLLVTATPIINRADDLAHQLLLALPDGALRAHGMVSLLRGAREGRGLEALGAVVVAGTAVAGPPVHRTRVRLPLDPRGAELLAGVDRLGGSHDPGIAALVRQLLVRALASSPEALAAMLERYRLLLLQARDAATSGIRPARHDLRRLAGPDGAQLVLWPVLGGEAGPLDLVLEDLAMLPALQRAAAGPATDPRRPRLADLVADAHPTAVFSGWRDTVAALRRLHPAAAWCTGDAAGVGHLRMPRADVLEPFERADGPRAREPRLLLSTDVASEGLNLRGVRRVVHWDLPWTPARLAQRAGRARRLDSRWPGIEEVTFLPPAAFERRLGVMEALVAKQRVWQRVLAEPPWRWHAALAEALPGAGVEGMAVVGGALDGVLAAVRFACRHGPGTTSLGGWIGWWDGASWRVERDAVTRALAAALEGTPAPGRPAPEGAMGALARLVATRLAALVAAGHADGRDERATAAMRRRLQALAIEARRTRDAAGLARADRGLRWLAAGGGAGVRGLVRRWQAVDDRRLLQALERLPAPPESPGVPVAELAGLIVFTGAGPD